jgi:hypothetical protein
MSSMRPIRTITTALLVASLAVAGCARSQPDQGATQTSGPPAAKTAPATPSTREPVVLADGRHTVYLKTVDPNRRTITFDLIQFLGIEEAKRDAGPDRDWRDLAPNGNYIRNVNPKLRTLPVPTEATITVITLAWTGHNNDSDVNVPVSLAKLANYMPVGKRPFSITVHHDQVVSLAEIFVP